MSCEIYLLFDPSSPVFHNERACYFSATWNLASDDTWSCKTLSLGNDRNCSAEIVNPHMIRDNKERNIRKEGISDFACANASLGGSRSFRSVESDSFRTPKFTSVSVSRTSNGVLTPKFSQNLSKILTTSANFCQTLDGSFSAAASKAIFATKTIADFSRSTRFARFLYRVFSAAWWWVRILSRWST